MSALELGSLILAGEFALIAWAILFIMLRRQRKLIHTEQAHAGAVMEHLETNEISRRDALSTLFESTYRLEGDELTAKVDEYVAREKAFYNAMLSLYLERDGEKLKDIPAELTKVLNPWVHLTPSGMVHSSEIGNLESEKAELAAELQSTKKTLEQLMDEYMAAFARSNPKPDEAASPPATPPAIKQTESAADIVLEEDAPGMDWGDFSSLSGGDDSPAEVEIDSMIEADPIEPRNLEDVFKESTPDGDQIPSAPPASGNPNDDLQDEIAREELEGLADLFDIPSSKG